MRMVVFGEVALGCPIRAETCSTLWRSAEGRNPFFLAWPASGLGRVLLVPFLAFEAAVDVPEGFACPFSLAAGTAAAVVEVVASSFFPLAALTGVFFSY